MENYKEINHILHNALESSKKGEGTVIAICGESGIGKTHLIKSFIDTEAKDFFIFKTDNSPTDQTTLSPIYNTLYQAVSDAQISKQAYVTLIRKYTRLLPIFGKYFTPITTDSYREAFGEIVARSGIGFDNAIGPNIIRFAKEISKNKKVLWFCDDIQWLDNESWEALVNICSSAHSNGWVIILVYNERSETCWDSHSSIAKAFEYWSKNNEQLGWRRIDAKHWNKENLLELCQGLLGAPCKFTDCNIQTLHKFTSGIPLYLKSALSALQENGKIKKTSDQWIELGTWKELEIQSDLRATILRRLKRVYSALPKSKKHLEVASVIGVSFEEGIIDKVLNTQDACNILSQIESQFGIVEYLVEDRHWIFDHNIYREIIYRSLGKHVCQLHLAIAVHLEKMPESYADPISIAYHYEKGGNILAASKIRMSESKRLLEQALFESALRLLDGTLHMLEPIQHQIGIDYSENIKMLRSRLLFHTSRYDEAINNFYFIIKSTKNNELKAYAHNWLGKSLTKLSSLNDFKLGIEHLSLAKEFYLSVNDSKLLGDVLIDLVVAHAHSNNFKESEKLFKQAEKIFSNANDRLGMARLQRRNVIFMESELSAPILEKTASVFERSGIPHEMIMSLNNAATEYLYIDEYDKATKCLCKAIEKSLDIGGFHLAYMYNNLSLPDIIHGKYDDANKKLCQALEETNRTVVKIVIDNNMAVAQAETLGVEHAQHSFHRILETSKTVGENAYITPAVVNLAICLKKSGKYEEAITVLNTITPNQENSYSKYKYKRWLNIMLDLYNITRNGKQISLLEDKYQWCNSTHDNMYYNYTYALIDLQFWGD